MNKTALNKQNNKSVFARISDMGIRLLVWLHSHCLCKLPLLFTTCGCSDMKVILALVWQKCESSTFHIPLIHKLTCIIFCVHPCDRVKGCGVDVAGGCGAWIRRASTQAYMTNTRPLAGLHAARPAFPYFFSWQSLGHIPHPRYAVSLFTLALSFFFFSLSVDRSWCRLLVIKSEQSSNV